jgi:lipopolysaccharide export system protein LptC
MKLNIILGVMIVIIIGILVFKSQQRDCEVVDNKSDCQCITHKKCDHTNS